MRASESNRHFKGFQDSMNKISRFALTMAVWLSAIAVPCQASAQASPESSTLTNDKATKSASDKSQAQRKVADGKKRDLLLTKEQLRDCLEQEANTKADGHAVAKEQAALDELKASISTKDTELAQSRSTLDPTDESARNALDDQSRDLDKKIDDYNARLPAFNEHAQSYKMSSAAWKASCANKRFEDSDLQAIKRARQ